MSAEKSEGTVGALVQGPATSNHHLQSWRLGLVISGLCLGIFLLGLDVNIVSVAIPHITTQFGSLNAVSWYGSAYLMTVTAFQPGFGTLYKYFNAKVTYIASLLIFEGRLVFCECPPIPWNQKLKYCSGINCLCCCPIIKCSDIRPRSSRGGCRWPSTGSTRHHRILCST